MKRTMAALLVAGAGLAVGCADARIPEPATAVTAGPFVIEGWVTEVGFDRVEVLTPVGLTANLRWPGDVAVTEGEREVHRAQLAAGTPVQAAYVVEQGRPVLLQMQVLPPEDPEVARPLPPPQEQQPLE